MRLQFRREVGLQRAARRRASIHAAAPDLEGVTRRSTGSRAEPEALG